MHVFEGAVLGIRNPGGHTFPEGTKQRAIEYISLLNLLAYRVQEAKAANVALLPLPAQLWAWKGESHQGITARDLNARFC